ncbi:MAG: TetR/AcrR family transcriptional repressor of nem operon [Crocinitomix sp.]|jgi:TetR/AcrR family transcriptional repressor of nem operon
MRSKAEQTTEFIITTVAPIFNKNGYYGTSMSDITKATGLTKGAIYGNFKNKEDLAFAAFKFNVDLVVDQIKAELIQIDSPIAQLRALLNYYRRYRSHTIEIGGCPILNIGVDANHQNSQLLAKVQEVVKKLQFYIRKMIELGQEAKEVKADINAEQYAKRIFALIEGAIFMTVTMNDDSYVNDMMDHADRIVDVELSE